MSEDIFSWASDIESYYSNNRVNFKYFPISYGKVPRANNYFEMVNLYLNSQNYSLILCKVGSNYTCLISIIDSFS